MNFDALTGWDLLFPRHPLLIAIWLLIGVMVGWMLREWLRRKW